MSCAGNTQGDCYAAVWAQRVVNNGGARPSQTTIDAAATFHNTLRTTGLLSKMLVVNFVAPDSLIAAQTPFIKGGGLDPWTNLSGNLVAADLTVNGIKGNSSNNGMDTGVVPNTLGAYVNNIGLTTYRSTGVNESTRCAMGATDLVNQLALFPAGNDFPTTWDSWTYDPGGRCSVSPSDQSSSPRLGFFSGNRIAANDSKIYFANGASAHAQIASIAGFAGSTNFVATIYAMGRHAAGLDVVSGSTYSFFAIHSGLTSSESEDLYDAVVTLRTALGGGLYPFGGWDDMQSYADGASLNGLNGGSGTNVTWAGAYVDRAVNTATAWAGRVSSGGTVSDVTVGAVDTFLSELQSAGILSKMYMVNIFAPDSLLAARTPIYRSAGNWVNTNANFVDGDLTINGLKGNASNKRLSTGFSPLTSAVSNNWGLSVYVSQYVAENDTTLIGSFSGTYQGTLIALANNLVKFMSLAWVEDNGRLTTAATTGGYYSANRTAANAIAIYHANGATPHTTLKSGTFGENGSYPAGELYLFAETAGAYSAHRMSFAAIHQGLTSSESVALYNAIDTLRTTIGGGTV